ncbi:outer membrane beta-barrel protein [Carboxylicivirga sp. N1Y90]|uniref:outer membrane beta-barrel protein n=1 Tax=Carboxylicivirga fragile TaxID=3417571 RepID=UPI003D3268A6|nr:outer membrane beta-barrel protein [Marinilabiliaceae bacterium N1Y90]
MMRSLLLVGLLLMCHCISAQYKVGDWYLSPKISFADYSDKDDWSGYSISKVPPISMTLEYGLNQYLSTGVTLGFSHDKFTNDTLNSNVHRFSTLAFGGIGSFHFAGLIEKWSNYSVFLGDWDFYLNAGFLLELDRNSEENVWDEERKVFKSSETSDLSFRIRPAIGVRYFLTDDFCMLVEVGRTNLGLVTTGLSWQF